VTAGGAACGLLNADGEAPQPPPADDRQDEEPCGRDLLLVELASLLLLAALVAAYHLGRNTDGFNDPIEIHNVAAETAEKIRLNQLARLEAEKNQQKEASKK